MYIQVKGKPYPNTPIKSLLAALTAALPSTPQHSVPKIQLPPPRTPLDAKSAHLTQSQLWPAIQSFIRPGDAIVSETGTSNWGICDMTFPADIRLVTQIYFGSIGFATAATLGADIARREVENKTKSQGGEGEGRTILMTGDGSMALTIQEIGTMIKAKCKTIVFVINNDGYTVERLIWGAQQRKSFFLTPPPPSCSSLAIYEKTRENGQTKKLD
jgi:pyruvate decarboxylase